MNSPTCCIANRARSRLARGPGLAECEDCGQTIPEARRRAVPGARRCIAGQQRQLQPQYHVT